MTKIKKNAIRAYNVYVHTHTHTYISSLIDTKHYLEILQLLVLY